MDTEKATIKAVVGGGLFLPPGSPAIPMVKAATKFKNPEWITAMSSRSIGRYIPVPDEWIYAGMEIPDGHPWAGGWAAPRGLDVESICKDDFKVEVNHRYSDGVAQSKLMLADGIKLRPYQEKAVGIFSSLGVGYIVAPTGAGKTQIGIGVISKYQRKTLVLVNTKDLAKQWMERINSTLIDEETGNPPIVSICGDGKWDDSGRIVVALFQSISKINFRDRYDWGRQFGLVIADECHRVPASTFTAVMTAMPARFRLGVTATPDRNDGLTVVLDFTFGPRVLEIGLEELAAIGAVVIPEVRMVKTGWYAPEDDDGTHGPMYAWPSLISKLLSDNKRNGIIIDEIKALVADGRQVLVLSDRVEHCISLVNMLSGAEGIMATAIYGTSKTREADLKAVKEGGFNVCIATQLADEGLDIPALGAVLLTSPTKALNRVKQRVGRIMRPLPGKKRPIVVDFVDDIPAMTGIARKRWRLYQSMGCSISFVEAR